MINSEKKVLRGLAQKIAEIADLPIHKEKKELWIRLNKLERVKPLIHVQALPKELWDELIPADTLKTTDDFARKQELGLRKKIYCWENFRDDRVVDNTIVCPIVINDTDFGINLNTNNPDKESGAVSYNSVIEHEQDIDKIKMPEISTDREETDRHYNRLCEIYDGILNVEKRGIDFFWFQIIDLLVRWRSMDLVFFDLIDRPEWIHEVCERITQGWIFKLEQLEKLNLLSSGNGNTMLGSGGYGFTDQLPQSDFDGHHVRIKDLWARAATQTFTEIISPEMHEEFAVRYEKRLLELFGLSCYGCCEPLHKKMHLVRPIKNLRRVSMSPWADIETAAAEIGKDYIFTHKPHPNIVSLQTWNPELAREQLTDAFEKTKDNIVEVNLQDIHTVNNEPHRLTEWTKIAMELAEEYA